MTIWRSIPCSSSSFYASSSSSHSSPCSSSLVRPWWRRPGTVEMAGCGGGGGGGGKRSLFEGAVRLLTTSSSRVRRMRCTTSAVFSPAVIQDAGATVVTLGGAYSLVRTFDVLTDRNVIDQKLSRKIVHVLSGLFFVSSWPLFSSSMEARLFASVVPLLNSFRLVIYGFSLAKDEGLIKSVTREGNPKELLRGPLYYVLVLLFCVVTFWRNSPVGVIALTMMSAGDGFADIMGRRYGKIKLPYNDHKSWVGSISMFLSGLFMSLGMLYYYSSLGFVELDWSNVVEKVALVSAVATIVESFPIGDVLDDNISVPLSSMLMALLVFGHKV